MGIRKAAGGDQISTGFSPVIAGLIGTSLLEDKLKIEESIIAFL